MFTSTAFSSSIVQLNAVAGFLIETRRKSSLLWKWNHRLGIGIIPNFPTEVGWVIKWKISWLKRKVNYHRNGLSFISLGCWQELEGNAISETLFFSSLFINPWPLPPSSNLCQPCEVLLIDSDSLVRMIIYPSPLWAERVMSLEKDYEVAFIDCNKAKI